MCCGKTVEKSVPAHTDKNHNIIVSEIDDELYIEINHEMTKTHFIGFVAYVGVDRVLVVRLYPEQDSVARLPKMYGGKIYFYCNKHGLFEY